MREIIAGENSLDNTPPGSCLGGWMKSMTGSTGRGWRWWKKIESAEGGKGRLAMVH